MQNNFSSSTYYNNHNFSPFPSKNDDYQYTTKYHLDQSVQLTSSSSSVSLDGSEYELLDFSDSEDIVESGEQTPTESSLNSCPSSCSDISSHKIATSATALSTTSSSTAQTQDLLPVKRPRLNKKRYRANLFPRIIKRDLRRLYPRMLTNIMNSGNPHLVSAFFSTFARGDCLFSACDDIDTTKTSAITSNNGNNTTTTTTTTKMMRPGFRDFEALLLNFAIQCDLMPDMTFNMRSAKIHQYRKPNSDNNSVNNNPLYSSEIMFVFEVNGTKLYAYDRSTTSDIALHIEDFMSFMSKAGSINENAITNNSYGDDKSDNKYHDNDNQKSFFLPANVPKHIAEKKTSIAHAPLLFQMIGNMRLVVDEENRISGVYCLGD